MDILNQSEIDALLNEAGGGEVREASPASKNAAKAPIQSATVTLPDEYRLETTNQELKRLLPVRVPVVVRLAERRAKINNILNWTAGTIIEFDKKADSDLDLVVSNVTIGMGNAVKCGERFGLRIARIQPWMERLISLGLVR